MRVLVACEESQAVAKEFRRIGHEAYSCDRKPCTGGHPEWHIQGEALEVIRRGWDILIAHPPCTYMSVGSAVRMYPRKGEVDPARLAKAMEGKAFFMAMLNSGVPQIAVENPTPLKIVGLPRPTQVIQPYQFGEPYSKRTCLWLKGLPPLRPTKVLTEYQPFINGGGGRLDKPNYRGKKFATDDGSGTRRSKTFPGIARAMAEQWGR